MTDSEPKPATDDEIITLPEGIIIVHRGTHRGGFDFRPNASVTLTQNCFADLDGALVQVEWKPNAQDGGEQ